MKVTMVFPPLLTVKYIPCTSECIGRAQPETIKSFTAISVGALIAASIMMVVSNLLGEKALIVFYTFVVALIVLIVFYVIRVFIKNKKNIDVENA